MLGLPAALALGVLLLAGLPATGLAADPSGQELDALTITPSDLPAGFATSASMAEGFFATADALATALDSSPGLARHGATVLERSSGADHEFVVAVLFSPLSASDQARFDREVAAPSAADQISASLALGSASPLAVARVGTSRLGVRIEEYGGDVVEELVVFRRGPVLAFAGHAWVAGTTTTASLDTVAGVLDGRLAAVTGVEPPVFRPPGLLVPALTTHIPTPLDVSTDPAVVGTNLVLSALALLVLTITARLATSMLDAHEEQLGRLARRGLPGRLAGLLGRLRVPGPGGRATAAVRPLAVALFYGLVFSLLDTTWDPLSATGIWLLVSLTIACGVIGLGDDLVQWRLARSMSLPASFGVRPSGAAAAVASTVISRATAVVPGLMFGTPEALRIDAAAIGPERATRLTVAGFTSLVAVGSAAWAGTVATSAVTRAGTAPALVGGVEALLLLVYAAAAQNLFVALLGLKGSTGELLRQRSRLGWGVALAIVTFLFWHTLLNPAGDPAVALASRNVQVVLGLVGAFSVLTLGAWIMLRVSRPAIVPAVTPIPPVQPSPAATATPPGQPSPAATATPPVQPSPTAGPALAMAPPPPVTPVPTVSRGGAPVDVVLGSADARVRGPVLLRFAGPWVTSRVVLIDPVAAAQLRGFSLLSGLAVLGPAIGYAVWLDGREPPDAAVAGLLAILLAWLVALAAARVWTERHRVAHTAVFGAASVGRVAVRRRWGVALVLAILLTPLAGVAYLALSHARVVLVEAPFTVGGGRPVRLRLAGDEAEGRRLEQLVLSASLPA